MQALKICTLLVKIKGFNHFVKKRDNRKIIVQINCINLLCAHSDF